MDGRIVLVYAKNPMGYMSLGPHRIYGKYFNYGRFGPSDIPRQMYKENKDILTEAEYTTEWLEEKFDKKFPQVSFKISEFYKVDIDTLIEIALLVGIKYRRPRAITDLEIRALRRVVIKKLTD